MESIKEVLMKRDGLSEKQAERKVQSAKKKISAYIAKGNFEKAENVCYNLGLEPDYIFELIY